MDGTDVCFAPVLTLEEAPQHPHNVARQTFVEIDGRHPAGAGAAVLGHARRDPGRRRRPSARDNDAALGDWGFSAGEIEALKGAGAL